MIGKAGLGTPHMDGNTRLCTATAARALHRDVRLRRPARLVRPTSTSTDAILLVGHNIASQQTVLWMRILDRLGGPNPPKLVVIDPRRTDDGQGGRRPPRPAARDERRRAERAAEPDDRGRAGSTAQFIDAHTVGFEKLRDDGRAVDRPSASRRSPASRPRELRAAAEILGTTRRARLDGASRASTSRTRRPPRPSR